MFCLRSRYEDLNSEFKMEVLTARQEGVVLRLTKEKAVWIVVMASMLATDVGHLYAAYTIAPERMSQIGSWNGDEWVNYGTLMGGMALRAGFCWVLAVIDEFEELERFQ